MTELVYVITNPISGGARGEELVRLMGEPVHLVDEKRGLDAIVKIFDIRVGESGIKPAFQSLLADVSSRTGASPSTERINSNAEHASAPESIDTIISPSSAPLKTTPIPLIVAGGDGTVMWALSELQAHNIAADAVAVGVLPFGTGNDFGRATGWGGYSPITIVGKNMTALKRIVSMYLRAESSWYDIWDVEISGERILKIQDKKKVEVGFDDEVGLMRLKKSCCNYFSIGTEARVGLGFDRHRTRSSICNKFVYACEGAKKLFKKNPKVGDFLVSVEPGNLSAPLIDSKPASLVFLNVPSISGGVDLWKNGVGDFETPQSFADGKIELLSLYSFFAFARALVYPAGAATRRAQCEGPVKLKFDMGNPPEGSPVPRLYMQVDGEFFQVNRAREVQVEFNRRVLVLLSENPVGCK